MHTKLKLTIFLILLPLLFGPHKGGTEVFKTKNVLLNEVFADCDTVIRKTAFLTKTQVRAIEKLGRAKLKSRIVNYYQALKADSVRGYAYFETEIVRSKSATYVVVLNMNANIEKVETLAFYEPTDYLPRPKWFELFSGRKLDNQLWPKRAIDNVTGATLTVQAVTGGVRRVLATHQILTSGD
jgi:hypothetical protein